jgi:hypothetical protein
MQAFAGSHPEIARARLAKRGHFRTGKKPRIIEAFPMSIRVPAHRLPQHTGPDVRSVHMH